MSSIMTYLDIHYPKYSLSYFPNINAVAFQFALECGIFFKFCSSLSKYYIQYSLDMNNVSFRHDSTYYNPFKFLLLILGVGSGGPDIPIGTLQGS